MIENFNKAYKCKDSGLWKWGSNGKAQFETKAQAERFGLDLLTDRLRYVRDRLNNACINHGRV